MFRHILIGAILALWVTACENPLIEHDHEHDHEHSHETGSYFKQHWHTEKGIFHQNTEINLTEEQITNRLNRLFEDYWDGDKIIAEEFFAKPLIFKGEAVSVKRREVYKEEVVTFRIPIRPEENEYILVTIILKLDNGFVGSFKENNWYILAVTVIDFYSTYGEIRYVDVYGELAP